MMIKTRLPKLEDSQKIYELIQNSPPLDLNSRYLYMLQATHFHNTCVVAELAPTNGEGDSQMAGFISGYRLPESPESLFIWQVAVSSNARGKGVAKKMMYDLLQRPALKSIRQIMTTVTPSNTASLKLFESLARDLETKITREMGFDSALFGGDAHEAEMLYKIGPFDFSKSKFN